ncbi:MAG: multicopper oxidase domain-containing protein [Cyclobacteriaceae bacterium]
MKRREFIRKSGFSTITALVGSSVILKACHTEEDMIGEPNWIVENDFSQPLTIPSSLSNQIELNAGPSSGTILQAKTSRTLSYADGILAPVIKVNKGETVNINLHNNLSEVTNIHWHGLIVPEDMDGHPKDVAQPGGVLNYALPVLQRAGTYWYHPHPHKNTARQVFMGLAGMFIVNDQEEALLDLPSGEFEVPLIIQDKRFSGSTLDYSPTADEIMSGYLGEHIIVNGVHAPVLNVAPTWYRLRLLNGSTARVYNISFSNGLSFYIIGSDGGLLDSPEKVSSIMFGPGERLDILVDFSGLTTGKEVYVVSNKFSQYSAQGRQGFKVIKLIVQQAETNNFTLPATLSIINSIDPNQAIKTRTFDISAMPGGGGGHGGTNRHSINGKSFEMDRVDETVHAGTTEIWEFDNMMGDEIHPMHIHGVQFQVLLRMGGRNEIIASEKGWKDTVLLMPGEKVSVIMTFPVYKGTFVFHCHNLEHEDDGMMLNYEIV